MPKIFVMVIFFRWAFIGCKNHWPDDNLVSRSLNRILADHNILWYLPHDFVYRYWQEYQKKVKHFFSLFFRQHSSCPDWAGFFEDHWTGISDCNHKLFEARRSWWNPLSIVSEIGNLVWLDLYWLIGSEYLGAIWVDSDGQGEALLP